ncbi:hypothetical protein ScPMuIL_004058 [Solemya velum]
MNKRSAVSNASRNSLRVLLDLDQVLADFEGYFLELFRQKYPEHPFIPLEKRKGFHLTEQYKHLHPDAVEKTREIYHAEGFFYNLPEIPGACSAAKEMAAMDGVDVFICTSPMLTNEHCFVEKIRWVNDHLGPEWRGRTIITRDKTIANGHILIDDNLKILGACARPTWDHVVFRACHNRDAKLRGRSVLENWTDGSWRDLIEDYLKRI